FYEAAGGFGTLLIVTGKKWATREKVFRSMRLFMEQVAPQLRSLVPARAVTPCCMPSSNRPGRCERRPISMAAPLQPRAIKRR
ncbi:MAG: hypothetical protein WBD71_11730, partial [Xanthobacteraceae bacterium]